MRSALLTFILLLATPAQAQQPFDFKGALFESSISDLKAAHPAFMCEDAIDKVVADTECRPMRSYKCVTDRVPDEKSCIDQATKASSYAGAMAEIALMYYQDKFGMASIVTGTGNFPLVLGALREKYGEPTSSREEPVTNRAGATFVNQIMEWKRAGTTIRAEKYGMRLDRSSIRIFTDTYMDERNRRKTAQTKQSAKDI